MARVRGKQIGARWVYVGATLAVAALAVGLRAAYWTVPMGMDESDYWLRAQLWLEGSTLYGDLESNRGPVLYAIFAAIVYLRHLLAADPGVVLRVGASLAVGLTVGTMVYMLSRLLSLRAGVVGGVVLALLMAQPTLEATDANSEVWLLWPYTLFALLLMNIAGAYNEGSSTRRAYTAFGAGIALGLAVMVKQVVVVLALLPIVLALLDGGRRREWLRVTLACAGGAAVVAVLGLGFAAGTDQLAPFLVYGSNMGYASQPLARTRIEAAVSVLAVMTTSLVAPVLLFLGGCVPVGLDARRDARLRSMLLLTLAWFSLALLTVMAPGRYYLHYFVLLAPPTALVAAVASSAVSSRHRRETAIVVAGALVVGLVLLVHGYVVGLSNIPTYRLWSDIGPKAGAMLAAETNPGDEVFVWGAANAPLVYSDRRQASQVLWIYYPLSMYGDRGGDSDLGVTYVNPGERIVREWSRRQPEYVLLTKPLAPGTGAGGSNVEDDIRVPAMIESALASDYAPVASVSTYQGPVYLWRLKTPAR